jgi:hypothetical protein
MELITAKNARERATSLTNERHKEALKDIANKIYFASNQGHFSIEVSIMHTAIQDELTIKGYKVKSIGDFRDGTSYIISW